MRKVNPDFDKKVEEAMVFLVKKILESGNNPKPVILHSTRVGLYLYEQGFEKHVIVAGFLHDLVEDSDTTLQEIENSFGNKVAKLVEANTDRKSLADRLKRAKNTTNRCVKHGKEALTVKGADILDNSDYYKLAKDREEFNYLIGKMKYYLNASKGTLSGTKTWKKLNLQYQQLKT